MSGSSTATPWLTSAAAVLALACGSASALPPGLVDEVIIDGWNQAVGVTFAPDGRGFVWEKAGLVWVIENGVKLPEPLIDIRDEVRDFGDHGLLGLTLDPDFLSNGRIYLLYAVDYYYMTHFGQPDYDPAQSQLERDSCGRITRFTCNGLDNYHSIIPGSRQILIGETLGTGFPHLFDSHGIGTLAFGLDGSLFAGGGDSASWAEADNGGPRDGASNTGLADGVITPKEDVGAFRAQLVDCLGGKVIRIDPETGDGLPDNPFYDPAKPRAAKSRVWALGFRNPYRFSVKPDSATPQNPAGVLYVGDVGWYSAEEVNIVTRGGQNFGWPLFEGGGPAPEYPLIAPANLDAPNPLFGVNGCTKQYFTFADLLVQDTLGDPQWPNPCNPAVSVPASIPHFMHTRPIIQWGHGHPVLVPIYNGPDAAIVDVTSPQSPVESDFFWGDTAIGGLWYTSTALGAEFQNTYFVADFVGGFIKNFVFHEEDGDLHQVKPFEDDAGAIVCLTLNPVDQSLYFISYGYTGESVLRRISASGNQPPIVNLQMSQQYGAAPLGVQFSSDGTYDPEGGPITYDWDFGDGSPISHERRPFHIFEAPGSGPVRYDVTVTVTDNLDNSVTRSLFVTPNNTPPRAAITSPLDGARMVVSSAQNLPLLADISDDETPGDLNCSWQAILHHNTHTHPEAPINQCTADIMVGPHGSPGDTSYVELRLTVTDPQGLSVLTGSSVFPLRCDASDALPLEDFVACPGLTAYFTVTPVGTGPFLYQWQRELAPDTGLFVPLLDGSSAAWGGGARIEGASTATLAVIPDPGLFPADEIRYRCIVTGSCGSVTETPARLSICRADFDCSGFVDLEDFTAFVYAFEAGDPSADADGSGFVDTDDYDAFVHSFEQGC